MRMEFSADQSAGRVHGRYVTIQPTPYIYGSFWIWSDGVCKWNGSKMVSMMLLHCALTLVAQCIVIGPVCVFATGGRAGGRCLCVCGSVTRITRLDSASVP